MDPYHLNTGKYVPQIGFGTWEINPDESVAHMVTQALESGYRVIDAARIYGNEAGVGSGIASSGVPRSEVFLTSKLWNDDQGYDRTMDAVEASMRKLGVDYLDLYLIHWPASQRRHASWQALQQLYDDGVIKAGGVSNYTIGHLRELMERSSLVPAVNQVEFHPFIYEQQRPLLDFCAEHGILVEAYSPLSRLSQTDSQPIKEVVRQTGKSARQVVLRWCVQHGTMPLARTSNLEHLVSNFDIFDFELTPAQMESLNSLSDGERVTWDPVGMGA